MNRRVAGNDHVNLISDFFGASRVAITGAAGTIGQELVRQFLAYGVAEIRALDNDENGLFELDCLYRRDSRVQIEHCDVASPARTRRVLSGADYLFHAAALKHVPVCERTPAAAVDVNIAGVTNILEAALDAEVKRVVFTSSDKAVHPTNVMGASKLIGERLALAADRRNGSTLVSCTRFGNVAGSRGSVVPVFRDQILRGGAITLTSPFMTRFFMSKEQAVTLVIESMVHAQGGELFVTKMPSLRISDLAKVMIRLLAPLAGRRPEDVAIDLIGSRPGEKRYEELVSEEEMARTISIGDYLIVPSLKRPRAEYQRLGQGERLTRPYNSETEPALGEAEIEAFLRDNALIERRAESAPPRAIAAE